MPRELLMRCVKSITDQKMPKGSFEIIVVDDGSTDPPTWLGTAFDDCDIHVIEIEHGGPGAARNKGIETAKGRYLQFIDADDCLQPDSLNPCLDILHTEQPKIFRFKYNVCTGNQAYLPSIKNKKFKCSNTISGAVFMENNNLSGSPCTYIFERETAIKNNIRFETGVYHEDEEFNTRLHFHATSLIDSDAIIYNYCIRRNSITSNNNSDFEKKRIEDIFLLLERLIAFRKEQEGQCNPIQKRGLERKIATLTVDTILNLLYDKKSAKEIIIICNTRLRSLGLYPLPIGNYTFKYKIFRMLANSNIGLRLLRILIPKKKPQKR